MDINVRVRKSEPLRILSLALQYVESNKYNMRKATYSKIDTVYPTLDISLLRTQVTVNSIKIDNLVTDIMTEHTTMYLYEWVDTNNNPVKALSELLKRLYDIIYYIEVNKDNSVIFNKLYLYIDMAKGIVNHINDNI